MNQTFFGPSDSYNEQQRVYYNIDGFYNISL